MCNIYTRVQCLLITITNVQLKNKFDMENKTLTNYENGNDANRLLCAVYIKFRKGSSTTNDNGRWWIALDYALCKKRGSIVVLRGKIGNGDTGDRVCR